MGNRLRVVQPQAMQKLLTPQEAASLLGIKLSTLYTWAYRRQIPVQKVGRALRFSPSALTAWLAQKAWPPATADRPAETGAGGGDAA